MSQKLPGDDSRGFYEFPIIVTWLVLEKLMFYSYFSQEIKLLGILLTDDFNSNDIDLLEISSIVFFFFFERFIQKGILGKDDTKNLVSIPWLFLIWKTEGSCSLI